MPISQLPFKGILYIFQCIVHENDIFERFLSAFRLRDFLKRRMCEGLPDKSRFSMELNIPITRSRTYCRVKT